MYRDGFVADWEGEIKQEQGKLQKLYINATKNFDYGGVELQ